MLIPLTKAHIVKWCNDNYFTNGLLTHTTEEMAYIIHKYITTYAHNEQAIGKDGGKPTATCIAKGMER